MPPPSLPTQLPCLPAAAEAPRLPSTVAFCALQVLGHVKPASTMVEVSRLVHEDILVLIEVDAITELP